MAIRFRQQVAAWLLVLKLGSNPNTRPASRREASMSVIYSFLCTSYMPEHITAPGMGLSVGAPRGAGDRLAVVRTHWSRTGPLKPTHFWH